jgi:hypothetical protein
MTGPHARGATAMSVLHNPHDAITIRRAYPDDQSGLARLASLDSAPRIAGAALVAEEGGELLAAFDLERGAIVADPFRPTGHLAELLRTQVSATEPAARSPRSPRALLRALLGPTMPLDHRAA